MLICALVTFCSLLFVGSVAESQDCAKYHRKPALIGRDNKYKLWPDLISSYDVEYGDSLVGFDEAMEIIWKNQNPEDCSKAKYLIAEPFFQGVGSEMHVHGVALAIAIATKRVFLQHGGWSWRYKNPHCEGQQKANMECYYMPLSKCTLADAMATMQTTNPAYKQPLPLHLRTPPAPANATSPPAEATGQTRQLSIRPRDPNVVHRPNHLVQHVNPHNPHNGHNPHSPLNHPHNAHTGHHQQHNQHHGGHHVTWSARDDADLEAAVIKYGVQGHWQQIAEAMQKNGKSDYDCLHRFRNVVRKRLNTRGIPGPKGRPNFNDDDSLTDLLVEGYGVVLVNKVVSVVHEAKTNAMALVTQHDDKISDNVVMLSFKVMLEHRKYVANDFNHLLRCAEVARRGYHFWWWRALSASFFLRPNEATLELLQQHSDPIIRDAKGMCVSAYVRHGDKGIEMSLIPFKQYADAAYCMWQAQADNHNASAVSGINCAGTLISADKNTAALTAKDPSVVNTAVRTPLPAKDPRNKPTLRAPPGMGRETMPPSFAHIKQPLLHGFDPQHHQRIFYLGSEDPEVFREATNWASAHNVTLRYSNISQVLLSDRRGIMKHRDMENSMPPNRQMEYFSYLLHLGDLIRCRAFVCTLASNYCRLVDELRATVGGKANAYYADLSLESCAHPPCVRPFSIAGHRGEIYDPTYDTLWRR